MQKENKRILELDALIGIAALRVMSHKYYEKGILNLILLNECLVNLSMIKRKY